MNSLFGADLAAWLRLVLTPGVGRATARKLITAFEWPTEIFAKSPAELSKVVSEKEVLAYLRLYLQNPIIETGASHD